MTSAYGGAILLVLVYTAPERRCTITGVLVDHVRCIDKRHITPFITSASVYYYPCVSLYYPRVVSVLINHSRCNSLPVLRHGYHFTNWVLSE